MKAFVINLERAVERRRRMEEQFAALGLEAAFHPAVDARELTPEHYALVDRETRRRLGLWPQADGSIANWISQRRVMREIVENGPETAAIFEDDAGLSAELPAVLDALDRRPFAFDVVKLNRRSSKPFIPCERLETGPPGRPGALPRLRQRRLRHHARGGAPFSREHAPDDARNRPGAIPFLGERAERVLRRPARRLPRRSGRLADRARPQTRAQRTQARRRRILRNVAARGERRLARFPEARGLPPPPARRNRGYAAFRHGHIRCCRDRSRRVRGPRACPGSRSCGMSDIYVRHTMRPESWRRKKGPHICGPYTNITLPQMADLRLRPRHAS